MQENHTCGKGCVLFSVHISSDKGKEDEDDEVLKRYPILWKFQNVFLVDIPNLTPHREVDFSIELISGAALESKALYMMSIPKLVELKL